MTRVSVIIPCFNDGAMLHESVASALAQDHDDVEIIVADDGSTDETSLATLDAVGQLGAIVMKLPHRGVSSTRNAAIAASTGDYILPLDADDLLWSGYSRAG